MALRVRVKFEDDAKLHEAIANGRDEDGNTLYHHASRSGCIHLLNALGRSSEIHMKNSLGQTALHLADSASCFKWLIDNGAEVNVPDMNGQTPIFQASSLEVLSVLLNHGAKVDMKDAMNNTPMHYMLMRSQLPDPACLRLLLHAGADVNSQNHKLWTPLFYCAFADQDSNQDSLRSLILLLLAQGADPDLVDMNGLTVAHYLALKGRCDLLSLVLPHMTLNFSSVSTIREILLYYYKDESSFCKLVKSFDKKKKRNFVSPVPYQPKRREIIERYYHFNKMDSEIFDDWSERFKPKPYAERAMARNFWNKFSKCTTAKEILNVSKNFYLGTIHSDCNREEKCQIGQSIRETLNSIIEILYSVIDERFAFELLPVGSSVDGSKLFLPDEFDYLLVSHDPDVIVNIRPTCFKAVLSEAIKVAFANDLPNNPHLKFLFLEATNLLRRKFCYKIHFTWRGKLFKYLHISVDLTPVWRCAPHDGDRLSSEYWQMFSGLTDLTALPEEKREFFVIVSDHTSKQVVITIPTIENWILTSQGNLLQESYRLLKLIIASYSVTSAIREGMYNVKTALLNYFVQSGPPKSRESMPCYIMNVLEKELICNDKIPKFGFDVDRGYTVRNWCHGVRQDTNFLSIRRILGINGTDVRKLPQSLTLR